MSFKPGDYVQFKHAKHAAPLLRDANGVAREGPVPPPEEHIGRVERSPAQGLVSGAWVDIPGKISVVYMSQAHGALERVLLTEADLALVLPSPN